MININEKANTSILINSLEKIYNNSRITGKLESIDLYILNIIYNLLTGCCITLTNTQKMQLMDSYRKIYFNSKNICPSSLINKYLVEYKTKFVQAETDDCNITPIINKIFYWENRNFLDPDYDLVIVEQAKDTEFLFAQDFQTYEFFNSGYEWPLEIGDTRVMCINIYEIQPNIEYKLYNEFEEDITSSFYYHYIEETN